MKGLNMVLMLLLIISCKEEKKIKKDIKKDIRIGTQIWMAENLDTDKFRNGDPIPEAVTNEEWVKALKNKQPAWCYLNNDSDNGYKFGKLYNWYAVKDSRGLAPLGYHIPREEEWHTLLKYLVGITDKKNPYKEDPLYADLRAGIDASKKIANNEDWNIKNKEFKNSSGFSAQPGGSRFKDGDFSKTKCGYWWSSSEHNLFTDEVYNADLILSDFFVFHLNSMPLGTGMSVRCIKD